MPDPIKKKNPETAEESFDFWFHEWRPPPPDDSPQWVLDAVDAGRLQDYKVYKKLWKESGAPYVNLLTDDKLAKKRVERDDPHLGAHFKPSKRTLYNVLGTALMGEKMRETIPDTMNIGKSRNEFFGELAHAEQFKDVILPSYTFGKSNYVRRKLQEASPDVKHADQPLYNTKYLEDIPGFEEPTDISYWSGMDFNRKTKSVEHEAHRVILPSLEDRARDYYQELYDKKLIE